ncbi:hypothetical protein EDD18DRAFT_1180659, partial [Armillaria luteobubalina]
MSRGEWLLFLMLYFRPVFLGETEVTFSVSIQVSLSLLLRLTLPSTLYLETAASTKISLGYISTISLFHCDTLPAHL